MSKWIATYSYGIYLAHSFSNWFALTQFHSWTLFVVMIVVLPVALYHGIEHAAIAAWNKTCRQSLKPWIAEDDPCSSPELSAGASVAGLATEGPLDL